MRKLLFLVFTNDVCRRNHAFMYALDLQAQGHQVKIVLEGEATRCINQREGRFGELFADALRTGIIEGICKTAASGCASGDPERQVAGLAASLQVPLLDSMNGHAGISGLIQDGFEIVTF